MHSERDVYGEQSYTAVLRENARLAKAKTTTVDEFDSNSQIYINVFERKKRLSCFAEISEEVEFIAPEKESNCVDVLSDDSEKGFDFCDLMKTVKSVTKKVKSGKAGSKKKMVLQDCSKQFNI